MTIRTLPPVQAANQSRDDHVTGFRVESQTALRLSVMAGLVGRTALLQAYRVQAADRDRACRLVAASSCSIRYVFSGKGNGLNGHAALTRHYSSDSKDDLRVRYLDGEDSGKFCSLT